MSVRRQSESFRYTSFRPEQIRLMNILRDAGFAVRAEYPYVVQDDLNNRPQQYLADLAIMSNPITILEIQGASHDSDKGMLKTRRKRELSEKAGYKFIEIAAEMAKEYPEKSLLEMVLRGLK